MNSSTPSFLAALSRGIREGPAACVVPWRTLAALERWTVGHAYSPAQEPPLRLTGEAPAATLAIGGDVALHRWSPADDSAALFAGLAEVTGSADACIANLESQLTSIITPAGTIGSSLRADPAALEVLSRLRISSVTCANNHCLDFGGDGLAESIARLEKVGIMATGIAGKGRDGAGVLTVRGLRVGLLAYTDDWRSEGASPGSLHPAAHDPAKVRSAIAGLTSRADLIVVQLHWGYEWSMYPLRSQRDLARSYVEAGAHLVVCHHAHVPMGVETWRGGVIAHGLGNLYFGSPRRNSHPFRSASFVLRVGVVRGGVTSAELVPVRTDRTGRAAADTGARADRTLRCLFYLSGRLGEDRYLEFVEHSHHASQGATLLVDLARRIASGDRAGARERVRYMEPPRQRLLTAALRQRDGFLGQVGAVFEDLRDGRADPFAATVRAELETMVCSAERFLAGFRQVGRLP